MAKTQFEQNLENLKDSLDSQQVNFLEEEWRKIEQGELARFRQEREEACRSAIVTIQQERDEAIKEKRDSLRSALEYDVSIKFGQTRKKLEEALAVFSSGDTSNEI